MSFAVTTLAVMLSEAKHLIAVEAGLRCQRHEILPFGFAQGRRFAQDDGTHE